MKEPSVKKKKIFLIGSQGQLGTDLKRILSDYELLCPSREEVDISYFDQVKKYVDQFFPDFIINTAAFHQTDECEKNPQKSFLINTLAIKNLAEISKEKNIPLVHISTDYVFGLDENRNTPYTEDDLPGPVNIYGISKLAGEYCIRYTTQKYFIIRTSALFGVAGCRAKGGGNFIETMLQLGREKGEVKVKSDEFISPTYTKELAQHIAKLIETEYYGLYHITNHGQCSWYEFAQKIFELTNMKVNCIAVSSNDLPTLVKRPSYSVLENKNLRERGLDEMSFWQEALKKYLKEKGHIK
ncbi:MAG: dTDP-4-dehydrorhamnose reductase [Candidatus Paceibacterota bacterium]